VTESPFRRQERNCQVKVDIDVAHDVHNWLQQEGRQEIGSGSLLSVRLVFLVFRLLNPLAAFLCEFNQCQIVSVP
jgi:hypothetical protein